LCVDAAVTDVFDPDRDFHLGAAFADTLYHVLAPWNIDLSQLAKTP
jgi:hypothetical protein